MNVSALSQYCGAWILICPWSCFGCGCAPWYGNGTSTCPGTCYGSGSVTCPCSCSWSGTWSVCKTFSCVASGSDSLILSTCYERGDQMKVLLRGCANLMFLSTSRMTTGLLTPIHSLNQLLFCHAQNYRSLDVGNCLKSQPGVLKSICMKSNSSLFNHPRTLWSAELILNT